MKRLSFLLLACALALSPLPARSAGVLINEFMYQPASFNTNEEWIELANAGTNAVDLQGWRFTKGVNFTFTNSYVLNPGAYVVVAANYAKFASIYPTVAASGRALGGWTGTLRNGGDTIRLVDASTNPISEVTYADEGDWGIRRRSLTSGSGSSTNRGWEWFTPHDGTGRSAELINSALPLDCGQNWTASASVNGTPGAPNSAAASDIAPLIFDVGHFPLVPRSTNSVIITARIVALQTNGLTVRLFYRNDAAPQTSGFTSVTMLDDGAHGDGLAGDGVYGVILAPRANQSVVEFYVQVISGTSKSRTWPAPAVESIDGVGPSGQVANALYQVDDGIYAGSNPHYRIIMTEAERRQRYAINRSDNRSDALMNATLITIESNGAECRYLCGVRERGAGSRGASVPNHRLNVPSDRKWKGSSSMNLNSQYTYAQVAGYALASRAGLHTESARAVQLWVNGTNNASAGSSQYGHYAHLEPPGAEFVDAHFPNDSSGNMYRASSGNHTANLSYLGTSYASYVSAGYAKANNSSENDWTDLIGLTDVLNNTPNSSYAAAVRNVANVEQWALYFAAFSMAESEETSLATGNGDDYSLYRGGIDTRFQLLAHDWDTILGQGQGTFATNRNLFRMTNVAAVARFIQHQEFAPLYYAALRHLAETAYSPAEAGETIDQALGSWVPGGVISAMKTFATNRATWVLSQIPSSLSVASSLPVTLGYPQTTTPVVSINGLSDAIRTRTILVNGSTSSWTAWRARWTNNAVALQPGINRILVQALDATGAEIQRTTYDVWYNAGGTPVSGTISGNTLWSAASGPYNVTANVTIPAGSTLTIEPGTTIFVGPGVQITVSGSVLAQGTDTARIRFTKVPGSANWGSLDLINTGTTESRFAYVDFDLCAGASLGGRAAQMHVNNSRVFIDHCTWGSAPTQQFIFLDGSSFVIQASVFPSYAATLNGPTMIQGTNGIRAGGYGIFRDNYFGHTYGAGDTIDFTGGNRPAPILQIIGNVFDGGGDDQLDLDSADAWIEGNTFQHVHRDLNRTDDPSDTANAISGGVDIAGQYSEWTIVNNVFYDVDHAVLARQGSRFAFVNNSVVHVAKESGGGNIADLAPFNFTDKGFALPALALGAGAYIANNVIWDTPRLTANYSAANLTVIFENNLLPSAWSGPGGTNTVADPRLNLGVITNVATADWKTVREALMPRQGSLAIGGGWGAKYDKGGFNAPGLMIIGEPYPSTAATTASLRVLPGGTFAWGSTAYLWGYTHYKWKLDNGPWSAELGVTANQAINLSSLSAGPHTVYVSGKNDAGFYQDDTFAYPSNTSISAHLSASRTWIVTNAPGRVQINEVLAHNTGGVEIGGRSPDLIELYNPGSTAVDLTGMGISDDPGAPYKYVFDSGTTIAPGQFLLLFGDSDKDTNGVHIGFGLNQSGDGVFIRDTPARGGVLLDSVTFGIQLPNLSIARLADGRWSLASPTFPGPNAALPTGEAARMKINEWLTDESFGNDFVELLNTDTLPVDLSGCYVSDAPTGWPTQYQFPPLSFVPGSGYLVLVADGDVEQGADHLPFKLAPVRGEFALFSTALDVIDWILYGPQSTDVSEGRSPDGSATRGFFAQPTPGAPNPGAGNISITVSNFISNIFGPTNKLWKYNASGTDLGTGWRASAYNDGPWPSGFGLFGAESPGVYPYSILTPIPAPLANGIITLYFRTHFTWTNDSTWELWGTNYVDDGAVFYINGAEVGRLRISGTPAFDSFASNQGNEGQPEVLSFPTSSLINGDNVIAVELHQGSIDSSDDVFGIGLAAVKTVRTTNAISVALNEVMANNSTYTNADGSITDWLEIFNPSASAVDLADMSLSDDILSPRRWVFPPGVTLASGAYLTVRFDPNAPASTNAAGQLNTGFGFSSGGDKVLLFDKLSRSGALLDSIAFGVQAQDFTIGRVPNGIGNWALTLPTERSVNIAATLGNVASVRINEWMADPKSGEDWFELFNPAAQPVAIGDCYLTDNLNDRTQYRIPKLSFIGVGLQGYVKFDADGSPASGADHTNFKLSAGGEALGFYAPDGSTAIDAITFGSQAKGVSEGRFPDGAASIIRFTQTPTPGAANYLPFNDILINEALTHSDPPLEDAIELFNGTATPINIGGWYLSDTPGDPRKFRIPDNTIVQAGGYAVFYENQFNPTPGFGRSFALSSGDGDQIHLSVADALGNLAGYRVTEDFGAQANGTSFGKFETSIGFSFVSMSNRTFGVDSPTSVEQFRTGTGAQNSTPLVGPVVINEIHYHPPDLGTNDNALDEYIELYNFAPTNVPLYDVAFPTNVWRLRNAVDFDFAPNTTISAQSYLLIVGFDPATNASQTASFRARYGVAAGVPIVGPLRGKLANDDDNIELRRPDAPNLNDVPSVLVERVHYFDQAPWPYAADWNTNGNGISLQRVTPQRFGNDPVNWRAGFPTAGSASGPAAGSVPVLSLQPSNRVVTAGANITMVVSGSGSLPITVQWRFNGADIFGATNSTLTIPNVQYGNVGRYSARVMNAFGVAVTTNGTLSFAAAPDIVYQPQSRAAVIGDNVSFTVGARGAAPLGYQWRKDGTNIVGATSTSLPLNNVQTASQGAYTVVVSNSFGSVTSTIAYLLFNSSPTIVVQPLSTNGILGQPASLSVVAVGSPPMFYQWRLNGVNVAGGTDATLNISNVQLSHGGTYTVTVTNAFGSATSSNAVLTVVVPPVVTITATDANASEGGANPGQFTVTRTGATNFAVNVGLTVGGTALNGTDYQTIGSNVLLPAGVASATVDIIPFNDASPEATETVTLILNTAPDYILGNPSTATVTIVDDDNIAPSVSMIAPGPNSVYLVSPTNILLSATASDPDGGIAKVEFFWNGTNKIAEVAGPGPYNFNWVNAAAGSNVIVAVATDIYGRATTSVGVPIFVNGAPYVAITSPADSSSVPEGDVSIAAAAIDTNGAVTRVEFFIGGALFGSVTNAPYGVTMTNAALGSYQAFAVAYDNYGLISTSALVNFTVVVANTNFADMFALRGYVTGVTNYCVGTNGSASLESGEQPPYPGRTGGKSLWISWTAPAIGVVTIDTLGSTFDTLLSVYTNRPGVAPNVSNIVVVAQNDDATSPAALQSRVSFTNRVPGTMYHITVDGFRGVSGIVQLHVGMSNYSPYIVSQPANVAANPGTNVTFSVTAIGLAPLQYTWRFNGGALGGGSGPSLTIANVQQANVGMYDVVIANSVGAATSSVAMLTIKTGTPLTLSTAQRTNNVFSAVLGGAIGRYNIEVSTNMDAWTVLTTITNVTGQVSFSDTNAAPRRNYRARVAP